MHILFVSHNYPNPYNPIFGFFCKDQVEALKKYGHKVGVVSPLPIKASEFLTKKFALGFNSFINEGVLAYLFAFPSIPKLKRLRYYLIKKIGVFLLNKYVKENGVPDIIHLQVFPATQIALFAKNRYNIPFVYTEHFSSIERNLINKFEINLVNQASQHSKSNFAVSPSFAKALSSFTNRSFSCLPNVYNSALFKKDDSFKKNDSFTFINVASFDDNKNQTRLINSFKMVQSLHQDVHLILVGDGPIKNRMVSLTKKLELENYVKFAGYRTSIQIKKLLLSSHAFVLSSNYETFGVSIIEALACGIPVVSTKCGGPESIITDDTLGILCDLNVDSLSLAMKNLYNNYSSYDSAKISSIAFEEFSSLSIAKKLTTAYKECLD